MPLELSAYSGLDLEPITPSDAANLPNMARQIRCGGQGGSLKITTYQGTIRTTSIRSGEVLTLIVVKVFATGTTATGLEAVL